MSIAAKDRLKCIRDLEISDTTGNPWEDSQITERMCNRVKRDLNNPIVSRVQRKRVKGWRMPPNTVSVCRPGKWGNPFRVGDGLHKTIVECVEAYKRWIEAGTNYVSDESPPSIEEIQSELRGKNLACFCKLDQPCHADVLLSLANAKSEEPSE